MACAVPVLSTQRILPVAIMGNCIHVAAAIKNIHPMLQGLLILPVGSVVVLVEFYLVDLVHINARIMDPFSDSQYRRSTSYIARVLQV